MSSGGGGTQLVTMLATFVLIFISLAILNASIAKRKGKRCAAYGWLSIIPVVGGLFSIYLISLTDKAVIGKLDQLLKNT